MLLRSEDEYQDAVREVVIYEYARAIAGGMDVGTLELGIVSDRSEDTDWNIMQTSHARQ